jgi:predicted dehydrogenase
MPRGVQMSMRALINHLVTFNGGIMISLMKPSLPSRRPATSISCNRRSFLKMTAAVAAPSLLSFRLHGVGPNSKLQHACIGVGGMGAGDLQNFIQHQHVQIVALCDVDANTLRSAAKLVPEARTYSDWRELLEKEQVDSVNVTVPDHMHFPIAWTAIQKGKHVYCQKPMCHDVMEVRTLTEAAVRKGVVTQLGTQAAAGVGDRTAVQLIKAGAIGKIKHAYLCSNRPGAIENYRLKGPRPAASAPPPPALKWDLWLGTAPARPYAAGIYHPTKWRAWLDFGTGWSGDIGCHIFDPVWKGLGLTSPLSVVAEVQESWLNSPERQADNWPQGDHITWLFPGNALTSGSELTLEWFDGEFFPPKDVRALFSVDEYPPESFMLIGTDGAMLLGYGHGPLLLPEEKFKDYPRPNVTGGNHYHQFVDACLGTDRAASHFAQTGPMTEAILLGTVAIRVPGKKLTWAAPAMHIPSNPAAERYLRREYREGWRSIGIAVNAATNHSVT